MIEQLECTFLKPIYQIDENNVIVALYKTKEKCTTVTGQMLPTAKKVKYILKGEWTQHPKYGKQFALKDGYEIEKPTTASSIKDYLASGAVKGVGKKTAERIVNIFGEDTFRVMDENIEKLLTIPGITRKKLLKIKESYEENFNGREAIVLLGKHGISPKLASKAYQKFKQDTMKIIAEEPFKLSTVPGITFPMADAIGSDSEEYELNFERFCYCANYVLSENEMNGLRDIIGDRCAGSLSMTAQDFGNAMLRLLHKKEMTGAKIFEYTCRMLDEKQLYRVTSEGVHYIYKAGLYRIEKALCDNVVRLAGKDKRMGNIDSLIVKAEHDLGISLSEEQREAVRKAFGNKLSIIAGGAGTGKTTIIKVIVYIYKELYPEEELTFLAPTGKAAHRITETTGYNATTVHSCLSLGTEQIHDVIEEEVKIENGLVVVDEMSMLDTRVAYALFSAIAEGCKIILCGDDEQLQSVGAGAVLRDMIETDNLPVTMLNNVYRQDAGSNVYVNSHRIRNNISELCFGEDFKINEVSLPADMEEQMVEMYLQKIKEYGIENVMMLAPFKEREAGVNSLNEKIQNALHPDDSIQFQHSGKVFRKGDIVMQLRNTDTLANGDTGVVVEVDKKDGEQLVTVKFDNGIRTYVDDEAEELSLAYAYTVHKSQGSEAKCVIMCFHKMHSIMLNRSIVYTAITRAKDEVIIFGQNEAVIKGIQTVYKAKRNTHLKHMINYYAIL